MRSAQYAVIRYIADPARGEALNVGVLVWAGEQYRLRVDEAATRRVVRDNPFLLTVFTVFTIFMIVAILGVRDEPNGNR